MNNLISEEYLMHHGVKGMRWGIRKKRQEINTLARKSIEPNTKGKPPAAQIAKDLSTANKVAAQGIARSGKATKKVSLARRDPRTMSDRELQRAVSRMNLERQYNTLTSYDVQTGYGKTADILNTFGTVLAVGGSAVSIYATIKGLKG